MLPDFIMLEPYISNPMLNMVEPCPDLLWTGFTLFSPPAAAWLSLAEPVEGRTDLLLFSKWMMTLFKSTTTCCPFFSLPQWLPAWLADLFPPGEVVTVTVNLSRHLILILSDSRAYLVVHEWRITGWFSCSTQEIIRQSCKDKCRGILSAVHLLCITGLSVSILPAHKGQHVFKDKLIFIVSVFLYLFLLAVDIPFFLSIMKRCDEMTKRML